MNNDDQRFPDHVLFQRVEQIYSPAKDWPSCEMPLTTEHLIAAVGESLPGFFDDPELILRIFTELHFRYIKNEFNNKFYWLVNAAAGDHLIEEDFKF